MYQGYLLQSMYKKNRKYTVGAKAAGRSRVARTPGFGDGENKKRSVNGAYIGSEKGTVSRTGRGTANRSGKGSTNGSASRTVNRSGKGSTNGSASRTTNRSGKGSTNRSASRTANRSGKGTNNRSANITVNMSRRGTTSRSGKRNKSEIIRNARDFESTNVYLNKAQYTKKNTKRNALPKWQRPSLHEFLRLHKSILILLMTIAFIAMLGIGVVQYVRYHYRVKTVNVEGNTYYTDEEIQDIVMDGMFAHNSLYLSFKYNDKSIQNIPFIEKITVDIESADTINIHVYEKALAGCIQYLENYMYFDREGIIVEGSSELLDGVPVVKGLNFDRVVLYESLPVENADIFSEILNLTQLLAKYNLQADQMYFDSAYNVYLYFDNVEVAIGSKENIDEKVIQLPYILPSLEGKKGTLHLEDYDDSTDSVRFEEAS